MLAEGTVAFDEIQLVMNHAALHLQCSRRIEALRSENGTAVISLEEALRGKHP